jgi:hypothetical protein
MATHDQIEDVRQEIMRFRELLNIMKLKLDESERAYDQLFASVPPETLTATKEKDRQWQLAEQLVDDTSAIRKAASVARFNARELERAFEELHDIIVTHEEAKQE